MNAIDPTAMTEAKDRAREGELPALTGLRLLAALSVAFAHGWVHLVKYDPPDAVAGWAQTIAAFGMTMFFVLSGFVIHYNYRRLVTTQGWAGVGAFIWARFARLYPLFLMVLALDVLLGRKLHDFMAGSVVGFTEVLRALPYYFTFVQSWVYVPFSENSLIYVAGEDLPLTWSISTEWFFYLAYPAIALLVLRTRRPVVIIGLMIVWSVLWSAFARGLDARSADIDAWAVGRYGELAGVVRTASSAG
jgi:peptidoglycan/LPS O-acetylase OafA/YrhL